MCGRRALPQAAAEGDSPEPESPSAAESGAAAADTAGASELDYPPDAFDVLEKQRDDMIAACGGELPTEWAPIADGSVPIPVPFGSPGNTVASMRIKRRFSSKAMPYWLQFKDAEGVITDVIMKAGDDLRQDQVVLGMLQKFNEIWAREGVVHTPSIRTHSINLTTVFGPIFDGYVDVGSDQVHTLAGGGQVAVYAPLYRCLCATISSGFVEMLSRVRFSIDFHGFPAV